MEKMILNTKLLEINNLREEKKLSGLSDYIMLSFNTLN